MENNKENAVERLLKSYRRFYNMEAFPHHWRKAGISEKR